MWIYKGCLVLCLCLQTVLSVNTAEVPNNDNDKRLSTLENVGRLQEIRLKEQDIQIRHLMNTNTRMDTQNEKLFKQVVALQSVVSGLAEQNKKLHRRFEKLDKKINSFGMGRLNLKIKEITNSSHGDEGLWTGVSTDDEMDPDVDRNSKFGKGIIRGKRLLADINSKQMVAFYAYMNQGEKNPSRHHTFLFDVVKTNIGNAYNPYSGYFTAPVAGVYVISYSARVYCHNFIFVQLVKNSEVEGSIAADSREDCENDSASETIVIELNAGDVMFVRTHATTGTGGPGGSILSDYNGRIYFSGWLIGPKG